MTDEQFRSLCNVYGFAPSLALRKLIDCVRAQEIEACAKVCENIEEWQGEGTPCESRIPVEAKDA